MVKGRIVRYFGDRKFGFIETEDGEDVFFHRKEFMEKGILNVEFEIVETNKGGKAINIRKPKEK